MRYTIHADMDRAIDLATAFLDRGLSGLRDAIKNNERQVMSDKQYDNTNEIALWNPYDKNRKGYYQGKGEIGGDRIYDAVLVVRSEPKPKMPFADLWWRTESDPTGTARCTPIYNNDGKLGGKIDGWWVNVFKNEKGPPLRVKFKAMEPVGAAPSSEDAFTGPDDVPF